MSWGRAGEHCKASTRRSCINHGLRIGLSVAVLPVLLVLGTVVAWVVSF